MKVYNYLTRIEDWGRNQRERTVIVSNIFTAFISLTLFLSAFSCMIINFQVQNPAGGAGAMLGRINLVKQGEILTACPVTDAGLRDES